ncbi:hypothetical protein KP509_27G023200 [Ceratopteris richardii]|nr:hypothetical protein KP509_27G023200 [Ceratopteris richardii]
MSFSTSLPSGQSYYTLESLEAAASLPLPKSSLPPPAALLPSEQDRLLRLDPQTRALLAEREALDARARLIAAEKEALLRRGVPTTNLPADRRLDALAALEARGRLSYEELQALDLRARSLPHGMDVRPQESFLLPLDSRDRVPARGAGMHLGIPRQEPIVGPRGPPYIPSLDSLNGRRDLAAVRAFAAPRESYPFREGARPSHSLYSAPNNRHHPGGVREPVPARRFPPQEVGRKESRPVTTSRALQKPKTKPTPQESEGWCAVCKIDCQSKKNLHVHVIGKKHKAAVEGPAVDKTEEAPDEKSSPSSSQAEKKRASDGKAEVSNSAKRVKTTTDSTVDEKKVEAEGVKAADVKTQLDKPDPSMPVCEVCNIFTTGKKNLEIHLKGKKHAARVKELADKA